MAGERIELRDGAWRIWLSGMGEPDTILPVVERFRKALSAGLEKIEGAEGLWKVHEGGRSSIYGVEIEGNRYCVKLFHDHRLQTRLRTFLGWSKGRRAFKNGLRAIEQNIPVPPVYAYAEKTSGPVFLLMRFFEARQMNLYLEDMLADGADLTADPVFFEMAEAFADFTRNLHENSVCHNDFSPRNVLLKRENGVFELKLIDLEDVTFSREKSEQKRNIDHFTLKLARYVDRPALRLFCRKFSEGYEEQVTNK